MRKFKNLQLTLVIAVIFSVTYFTHAQEINPTGANEIPSVMLEGVNGNRTINGTTTYDGLSAGTVGNGGSYFGYFAGRVITATSSYNTFMGSFTGYSQTSGNNNTYVGTGAGIFGTTGSNNTMLGFLAGTQNSTGSGNVFLGYNAGYNETGSNTLYIDNTSIATPLVFGDFTANKLGINTKNLVNSVGGANTSAYSLYVKGGILTEELRIRTGWADYVFDSDYDLMPLNKVANYISENGHLPNVPSAKQVANEGIEVGDMTRIQQEKIEELTLYIIALEKQLQDLDAKVDVLSKQ